MELWQRQSDELLHTEPTLLLAPPTCKHIDLGEAIAEAIRDQTPTRLSCPLMSI